LSSTKPVLWKIARVVGAVDFAVIVVAEAVLGVAVDAAKAVMGVIVVEVVGKVALAAARMISAQVIDPAGIEGMALMVEAVGVPMGRVLETVGK
jgi:hypothetical protein